MDPTAPASDGTAVLTADPAPPPATVLNHPSYDEMILAAVAALKSPGGSSKKAISDYIQQNYPNLPPNHGTLLTHHLRSLKTGGRLLMTRNNYRLPDPEGSPRLRRGRPAKSQAVLAPDAIVPVPSDGEAPKADEAGTSGSQKRGRGGGRRPAKRQNTGPAEAVPPPANATGRPKRARGRPARLMKVPFEREAGGAQAVSGPQDQPKVVASRVEKLPVRRRGRPPRSNTATARAAGHPQSAGPSTSVAAPRVHDIDYEILQKKVEVMQTRIKDAVAVLKPHLAGEGSPAIMNAIVELEAIAAMDMKPTPTAD
ncbi:HMG-Y-related protein A [Punica granatum]|uniref:HMG-Y-related protein A n=1 Tax=Punica granatum TaxID=22663 RepID=A0A218VQ30_PUNGR|nr:HMG-Y-related protein A [Punica granatum]OWM62634.1 hypothetical protein CDL15_Pgr019928 [Punica granatum]